jgi:hypothetical protein
LVQRRFVLDARVDGHWRICPLPLILGSCPAPLQLVIRGLQAIG